VIDRNQGCEDCAVRGREYCVKLAYPIAISIRIRADLAYRRRRWQVDRYVYAAIAHEERIACRAAPDGADHSVR
jgi:hypothetical protein